MIIIEQLFSLIIKLIESLFKFLVEFVRFAVTSIPKNKNSYSAEFANPGILLSGRNDGFCLTGRKNLSVKLSYQNALILSLIHI